MAWNDREEEWKNGEKGEDLERTYCCQRPRFRRFETRFWGSVARFLRVKMMPLEDSHHEG